MPMKMPQVLYDLVQLKGGWDQISPPLSLPPGVLRDVQNFECAPTGGYARVGGYERFDGRPSPSAAAYVLIQVVTFTNTPAVGQTLTGNSSGATGYIIALGANYVILTKVTGSFTNVEVVKVGATTIGTATLPTVSVSSLLAAQYLNLAADQYRADIAAVPGSGKVLGVVGFAVSGVDQTYAFRANAGGSAIDLYAATTGGWSQIVFKKEVSFTTGGTGTPLDGTTLTQGGVTATVRRVMTSSGIWASNTAAGRFVIDTPAGGNFSAAGATLTGGINVTLTGVQTAITMTPGGKMEFVIGNFSGQLGTLRAYGADGTNRMFEFDGTTLAPIPTGVSPDTPKHVIEHHNYLICSVQSSFFYSGVGTPYRWTSTDGGGEIATGDIVTGFSVQPGAQTTGAMAVYCRSSTFMLYGTSAATWNFVTFNTGAGGIDYTAQNLEQSYVLDNRGVNALATTLNYGNFTQATITPQIKTFIDAERSKTSYSVVNRNKSQYRLFFNDGYGLYTTVVRGKLLGSTSVFFPDVVNCAWETTLTNGEEATYFGSTNGFVYQMEAGSSFDGASIDAFITLNWNTMKSPRLIKRYRHASVEMQGNFYAAIAFGFQLGYGTMLIGQPTPVPYVSGFEGAPPWDTFTWDNFTWDGRTLIPTEAGVTGSAENIQITISSTTDYIYPYTVNSVIVHYSPRRGLR